MRPTPKGWPRLTSGVFYDDAPAAIDWLCRAFGFEVRLKIEGEGGVIEHSELTLGTDGLVMVGSAAKKREGRVDFTRSPRAVGGFNTQSLMIYVDDVDAMCERARAAGGKITFAPQTFDYGDEYWSDRSGRVQDPEGHMWWIVQRLKG
jgi:uncharacterized glyoxalase superfamily protein PhnB